MYLWNNINFNVNTVGLMPLLQLNAECRPRDEPAQHYWGVLERLQKECKKKKFVNAARPVLI